MRRVIAILLVGFCVALPAQAQLATVSDIAGLRQAMQDYSCDSEVMQRLERNMLSIFSVKYP